MPGAAPKKARPTIGTRLTHFMPTKFHLHNVLFLVFNGDTSYSYPLSSFHLNLGPQGWPVLGGPLFSETGFRRSRADRAHSQSYLLSALVPNDDDVVRHSHVDEKSSRDWGLHGRLRISIRPFGQVDDILIERKRPVSVVTSRPLELSIYLPS